jgi:STE24 endopeptidase
MPLFNRFDPLEAGELKDAIMAYARSIGFSLDNIHVMDGSKRSSKSNAFFTGFGRHRRIVLFDTLIARHTTDELVAVLAHEMGHYKMRHILKMMAMGILQTGVLLYFMSLVITPRRCSKHFTSGTRRFTPGWSSSACFMRRWIFFWG